MGMLPLNIETGRFKLVKDDTTGNMRKQKVEERICSICNLSETEDELYFMFVCPKYKIPWLILIFEQKGKEKWPEYEGIRINMDKLMFGMKNLMLHVNKKTENLCCLSNTPHKI